MRRVATALLKSGRGNSINENVLHCREVLYRVAVGTRLFTFWEAAGSDIPTSCFSASITSSWSYRRYTFAPLRTPCHGILPAAAKRLTYCAVNPINAPIAFASTRFLCPTWITLLALLLGMFTFSSLGPRWWPACLHATPVRRSAHMHQFCGDRRRLRIAQRLSRRAPLNSQTAGRNGALQVK